MIIIRMPANKVKIYDYPTMHAAGGKRYLREFDIEELLLESHW